ncbi:hypothetical protein GWK47_045664 [Chionoecetes opilio]|uniref:Uncharacterized protein n=1 Tax=Chionoecetes opilio TaxID=41210 RepID=A0A8J5CHF6_CHIOP|nr:hypothetical protein GWK47_045664 [Chionoecetes opilio]
MFPILETRPQRCVGAGWHGNAAPPLHKPPLRNRSRASRGDSRRLSKPHRVWGISLHLCLVEYHQRRDVPAVLPVSRGDSLARVGLGGLQHPPVAGLDAGCCPASECARLHTTSRRGRRTLRHRAEEGGAKIILPRKQFESSALDETRRKGGGVEGRRRREEVGGRGSIANGARDVIAALGSSAESKFPGSFPQSEPVQGGKMVGRVFAIVQRPLCIGQRLESASVADVVRFV